MGRSRYIITNPELPHFITSTVLHWIPVFTRPATVDILLDSLRYMMGEGLKVYAYVILENHLHMVVQSSQLDRDIARFKSFTAKQLIRYLDANDIKPILEQLAFYKKAHKGDRAYQFWQEGVHPEWIQNEAMMWQKVEYIHQNPVERGYVDDAVHWRYSSARNYAGLAGLLEVYDMVRQICIPTLLGNCSCVALLPCIHAGMRGNAYRRKIMSRSHNLRQICTRWKAKQFNCRRDAGTPG